MFRISVYDGRLAPATHPYATERCATEREARQTAARMLGHTSLRGASTWERYQGGIVYQFGPKVEENGYDFAVIEEEDGMG